MKTLPVLAGLAAGCIAGCAGPIPVVDAPVARIEAPAARAGERWSYDEIDPYRRTVVGTLLQTAAGGAQRQAFSAPYTKLRFPLMPGMSWSERTEAVDAHGSVYPWRIAARASGWERVRTPAGEFDALRISRTMNLGDADDGWLDTTRTETLWYAPAVNGWVRVERHDKQREDAGRAPRNREDWRIWELREHVAG
jgi:hypothetical protein